MKFCISFSPVFVFLLLLLFFSALSRIWSTMMNRRNNNENPCLMPHFKGNAFKFSIWYFFVDILYQVSYVDEYLGEESKNSKSKGSVEGMCFECLRNTRKVNIAIGERMRRRESIRKWGQKVRTIQWGRGGAGMIV